MAERVTYTVSIGGRKAGAGGELLLLGLTIERSVQANGRCDIDLAAMGADPPKAGDPVTVDLDDGGGAFRVFTGQVEASGASSDGRRILAGDVSARLARLEVEAAWQAVSVGAVAKDLIRRAGAEPGKIVDGPALASWVARRRPAVLGQLRRLAALAGSDLWVDGAGKVHMSPAAKGAARHKLTIGKTVLAIDVAEMVPVRDSIAVWGEGGGDDKAHWLPTDLGRMVGKARLESDGSVSARASGKTPTTVVEGAMRSADALGRSAELQAAAWASRRLRGHVDVTDAPRVELGDLIAVDGIPDQRPAMLALLADRTLVVRGLRYSLDRSRGLLTRLRF